MSIQAKQQLNEWWSGFAAMVIMILVTLFIHDPNFHDPQEHEKFAMAMLHCNRYSYSGNHGPDSKV